MFGRKDLIVVTVNYRVNAFGFLAHQFLRDEDVDGSTGNYGVQDQRMALKWVQNNIRVIKFAEKLNKITISMLRSI